MVKIIQRRESSNRELVPYLSQYVVKTVAPFERQERIFQSNRSMERSSDLYLAIYRAPSVIPLQCPFHRLHRNWINLKITRKDDRPVANAGNSPTFRPSYRVMRLGLTFARYRIFYKVGPNIPSPFTNECRFLSNGRFFCIWFIWDFRDVTCSTLQL